MKKNPGRKDLRARIKRRRTMMSDKKQAQNERKMLWLRTGKHQEEKT